MEGKSTCVRAIVPLFILFVCSTKLQAQSCGCNVTISLTTQHYDAAAVLPGQTICLQAGIRTSNLVIMNINGAPNNRITIKNCGGPVIFKLAKWQGFGFKTQYSKHFRVTGTGSSDFYGIVIDSSANSMQFKELSTNFEVDHIQLSNPGFAGIMAKSDSSGPRSGFKMNNVSFHDIKIDKAGGEGFYIGNSFWSLTNYQHDIDTLELYNTIIDSSGREGIQVGCTYSGKAKIYNNRVTNSGLANIGGQRNGVQLGNGFSGRFYNNYVENTLANGLIVLGPGNVYAYNNVFVNPGTVGIYTGIATAEDGKHFYYLNNTFIMGNSNDYVIRYRPDKACTAYVHNNAVVRPPAATLRSFYRESGFMDTTGNVVRRNINDFNFEDPANDNYDILVGSVAIDSGINVAAYGVNDDFENRPRPVGNYDAGAYEYQGPSSSSVYRVNAGGLQVAGTPVNWTKDKQTDPCPWLATGSPNYTTGSDNTWSGTNNTDAPSQIFSTNRYAAFSGNTVSYDFPVSNGSYDVWLYFAENSVQASGQRVFDVNIEGNTVMDNFDIYATAGYRVAYKAPFTVTVSDGVLDLDIIQVTGNPQINGIAIQPAGTFVNSRSSQISITPADRITTNDQIRAYPIPLQNKLYVQKQTSAATGVEEVEVKLVSGAGMLLYRGKHRFTGGYLNPVDLSTLTLPSGVYFLRLSGPSTNQVIRLMKQ